MIAIVVALINVFLRLSDSDYEPPVSMNVAVAVLGGISVLLVLFRIVAPPGFGSFGGITVDATLQLGIFLGLLAAVGVAFGGYKGMQEEGRASAAPPTSYPAVAAPPPPPPPSRRLRLHLPPTPPPCQP